MIRLILFSRDSKLQRLVAPALGEEFEVVVERGTGRLQHLLGAGSSEVIILDLDSEYPSIGAQLDISQAYVHRLIRQAQNENSHAA
jgi:hypothetical protein